MKKRILQILLLAALCILLIKPVTCLVGAKSGLLLWFNIVLPTLFPYIVLVNLITALNLTRIISRLTYPLLHRLFSISKAGCFPIIGGCLSGYPVGASIIGNAVRTKQMTNCEARYLLNFCNNASPLFLISFVGLQSLSLGQLSYSIPVIVLFSSYIGSRLCNKPILVVNNNITRLPTDTYTQKSGFLLLNDVIMNSANVLVNVGGYIVLFSIAASLLNELTFIPSLLRVIITGFLEITTGINQLQLLPMSPCKKTALAVCLCTFGGLSSAFQTKSVLHKTKLSLLSYIICKIISSIIALLIAYLFFSFFLR